MTAPIPKSARLAAYEDFRDQYARAREEQADFLFEQCLAIADDDSGDVTIVTDGKGNAVERVDHENIQRSRLRVDTRKWMAAKLAPEKYGDRVMHEQQFLHAHATSATLIVCQYPEGETPQEGAESSRNGGERGADL
jgi:hypothetical protein